MAWRYPVGRRANPACERIHRRVRAAMTCVDLVIKAPVHTVWAVLADADSYAEWVAGAKETRDVDGPWPSRGSRFHYTVGMGPLNLKDTTQVLESEPNRRLVLEARARPLGRARIEITLSMVGAGTTVALDEQTLSPAAIRALGPVLEPFVKGRNNKALKHLARLAETKSRGVTPAAP